MGSRPGCGSTVYFTVILGKQEKQPEARRPTEQELASALEASRWGAPLREPL